MYGVIGSAVITGMILFYFFRKGSIKNYLGNKIEIEPKKKGFSRNIFGGIIFAAISLAWLVVVFPFEFVYFADVLPDSLKFLVQWISNDIARVLMGLDVIVLLGAAVYSPIAYKFVVIGTPNNETRVLEEK